MPSPRKGRRDGSVVDGAAAGVDGPRPVPGGRPGAVLPRYADQSFYAKRVCDSCPVAAECLDFALGFSVHDDHGVWGGLTRIERRKLRRLADQKGTAS